MLGGVIFDTDDKRMVNTILSGIVVDSIRDLVISYPIHHEETLPAHQDVGYIHDKSHNTVRYHILVAYSILP